MIIYVLSKMDYCLKWKTNQLINPKTRRKILLLGPTYKKLERECSNFLTATGFDNFQKVPRDKAKIVRYVIELLDKYIFENKFKRRLVVKFVDNDRAPGYSMCTGEKCVINLSKQLCVTVDDIYRTIVHEMCFIATVLTNYEWNAWSLRILKSFPSISLSKCYGPNDGKCDQCGKGAVYSVGSGDVGQLGLGPTIFDISKPRAVKLPIDCVQICAGGLHTLCLGTNGVPYSFGLNDEGALGRITLEEDDTFVPGKIDIKERIVQVSAGDSHSAALTSSGDVYVWGLFRDSNGPINAKMSTPVKISKLTNVVKITSGTDHLVCLTMDNRVYTMGNGEQGQLGRKVDKNDLEPGQVVLKKGHRRLLIDDVWTGQYNVFVRDSTSGDVYVWGLNNYFQLGIATDDEVIPFPVKSSVFSVRLWKTISGGQHHTLALSTNGTVYSIGRKDYGRLGQGNVNGIADAPLLNEVILPEKCSLISAGTAVSFAASVDGSIYSWGINTSQLGQGEMEHDVVVPKKITTKLGKFCVQLSAGGQHSILLICQNDQ
jgi:regulator of chromosome condensation